MYFDADCDAFWDYFILTDIYIYETGV